MIGSKNLVTLSVLILIVSLVHGQDRGSGNLQDKLSKLYKFFQERRICKEPVNTRKVFEGFYTLITFKCDWASFVDSINDAARANLDEDGSPRRRSPNKPAQLEVFDIEFNINGPKLTEAKYKTITAKLFENFNVRSLKASGLDIEKIDENAFSSSSFATYLQHLDLSRNSLRRIDGHTLSNLKSLQYLNLSSNRLSLGEHNFDGNIHLRTLDVSKNDIQYLSPRVFSQLHELEHLSVANNNIRKIDACTFASVQTSPISSKYAPVYIDLQGNSIECDCQVFYLNRHLNYRLNLTCEKPSYYKGKRFDQLNLEDPAYRCDYPKMHAKCHPHESLSERDKSLLLVTGSIIAVLFLVACCCCCNSISQSGKTVQLKSALAEARRANFQPKKNIYVNVVPLDDKEKLIVHDK